MQQNQLSDLQQLLKHYCNVLPVFGFNSKKLDINLIQTYLLAILNEGQDIEPGVHEKAKQYISSKFGDIQVLDIMNFFGGGTSLDSVSKAHKAAETKRFFPYEWFDHPGKKKDTELPRNMRFTVNCVVVIFLKSSARDMSIYSEVE